MVVDRTTEVAGLMNHLWLTVFSSERLKVKSGLKYISHTWDDYSSWYLWPDESHGVYKLELLGAQNIEGYDWLAEFIIKYYPATGEDAFHKLSGLERICRQSEVFNNHPAEGPPGCSCHGHSTEHETSRFRDLSHGTGIPSFQYKSIVPPDFFYAGNLVLAFKENEGSILKLKSQTSWHITMSEDFSALDGEGNTLAVLKKNEVDRDYPGFALSHFLYEIIINNWTAFHDYTFSEFSTFRSPGVRFLSSGTSLIKESSPEIERIIMQAELRYQTEKKLAPIPDEDMEGMKK
jgi:hypothetical protein